MTSDLIIWFLCLGKASPPAPPMPSGQQQPSYIVGGQTAEIGEWPWQAGLKRSAEDTIFCGGSLIKSQWIVTASHCLYDMIRYTTTPGKIPHIEVILGEFNQEKKGRKEVLVNVSKLFLHEQFNPETIDYDIALLKLESPVELSKTIRPVCLPEESMTFRPGTMCYVTGFGVTEQGGDVSATLQEASVPIVPQKTCQEAYKTKKITTRMFCAGLAEGGIDACQGDSGGPLVCKKNDSWVLKGIISWGVGCARPGAYGVYSNVQTFLPWILNIMNKEAPQDSEINLS